MPMGLTGADKADNGSWSIVGASFWVLCLSSGLWTSFGIFFKPIQGDLGTGRAAISLAPSINMLLYGSLLPFVGRMADLFGTRRMIILGVSSIALGGLLLSTARSLAELYIYYGVVIGFGISCSSLVTHQTLISHWFRKRKGLALSISSAGASSSQLIIIPLATQLIIAMGWRSTYLVLGLLLSVVALPLSIFVLRDAPASPHRTSIPIPDQVRVAVSQPISGRAPHKWVSCLSTVPFWLLAGGFFVCGFSWMLVMAHYPPFVTDSGYSPGTVAKMLAVMGVSNVLGNVMVGAASDRYGRKNLLGAMYALRAVAMAAIVLSQNIVVLYLFVLMAGFSLMATVPLTSGLTGDFYGAKDIGVIFGLITLSHQIGSAISSFMGGAMFDMLGGYRSAFILTAALLFTASVLSFSIKEKRPSLEKRAAMAPALSSKGS